MVTKAEWQPALHLFPLDIPFNSPSAESFTEANQKIRTKMFLQHAPDTSQFVLSRYTLNIQTQNACVNNQKADDPPVPKASSCVNPTRQGLKKVF